jgi:hypothetical protein
MPVDFGLGGIPVLNLNDIDAELYVHGGFIKVAQTNGFVRVYNNDRFIGVGDVQNHELRPKRTI